MKGALDALDFCIYAPSSAWDNEVPSAADPAPCVAPAHLPPCPWAKTMLGTRTASPVPPPLPQPLHLHLYRITLATT